MEMATSVVEQRETVGYSVRERLRIWEQRNPVAAALLLVITLFLVGWFTYTSAVAENEVRRNHPMEAR